MKYVLVVILFDQVGLGLSWGHGGVVGGVVQPRTDCSVGGKDGK